MKNEYWQGVLWLTIFILQHIGPLGAETENSTKIKYDVLSISPPMDYDQWKPLGRGDPLKNDPTYDYVPPVLDSVHYWADSPARKKDTLPGEHQKTEILLLGVSSRKPAISEPPADSRRDTFGQFLKFVEGPKFTNHFKALKPHFQLLPQYLPIIPNKKPPENEQKVPYTVLMPPPMVTKQPASLYINNENMEKVSSPVTEKVHPSITSSPFQTTESQVTIQTAELVYHSSSLGKVSDWATKNPTSVSPNNAMNVKVTPAGFQNIKPKYNEKIVYNIDLQPPESYMRIQFAPRNLTNRHLVAADSNININYVTAPSDILNQGIAKQTTTPLPKVVTSNIPPTIMQNSHMMIDSAVKHPIKFPSQTTPPVTTLQALKNILNKEKSTELNDHTNELKTSLKSTTFVTLPHTPTLKETTTVPPTTTTIKCLPTSTESLTTDPLFKHYKQPEELIAKPVYMIIQGHSKVKTYGPTKQMNGIPIQETNEITEDNEYQVKHLHGFDKGNIQNGSREGRSSGNIQNLKHVIQTGLGAIDISDLKDKNDVIETEVEVGYKVAPRKENLTANYRKGYVDEGEKLT